MKKEITTQDRIQRITAMEMLYDEIVTELGHLQKQQTLPELLQKKILDLERYYESADWLADKEADDCGELPKSLKRGILTEDTIYDLLCEADTRR